MSYNVGVHCHTCGNTLNDRDNYTSNVSRVWDKAGAPLREWDGKIGLEILPALHGAIKTLDNLLPYERTEYEQLVRGEGTWGDIEGATAFLKSIRDGICADPYARLSVSN